MKYLTIKKYHKSTLLSERKEVNNLRVFYCAKCGKLEKDFKISEKELGKCITYSNMRGGYGRPITHIVCPNCGYLLSGFMNAVNDDEDFIEYAKETIRMYVEPNIDGYWNNEDRERLIELIKQDRNKRKV